MTYTEWTLKVIQNVRTIRGCSYEEADSCVGGMMLLHGKPSQLAWTHRWYMAGVSPLQGAMNCCALGWGWEPRGALDKPCDELDETKVKIRSPQV
jgi:hypothetical protein